MRGNNSEKKAMFKFLSDDPFKVSVSHLKLRLKYISVTTVSRFWFCRDNIDDVLIKPFANPQVLSLSLSNLVGEGWCISTREVIH